MQRLAALRDYASGHGHDGNKVTPNSRVAALLALRPHLEQRHQLAGSERLQSLSALRPHAIAPEQSHQPAGSERVQLLSALQRESHAVDTAGFRIAAAAEPIAAERIIYISFSALREAQIKYDLAKSSLPSSGRKRWHYNSTQRKAAAKPRVRRSHAQTRAALCRVRPLMGADRCHCSGNTCFRALLHIAPDVVSFIQQYANAPKAVQDMTVMLQTEHCQHTCRQRLPSVCFLGCLMSATCWGKLMNFGPVRLGKLLSGRMWDSRMAGFRRLVDLATLRPKRLLCHFFILQMYIAQVETLPDAYVHKYSSRRKCRIAGAMTAMTHQAMTTQW